MTERRALALLAVFAFVMVVAGWWDAGWQTLGGSPSDAAFDWYATSAVFGDGTPYEPLNEISTLNAAHVHPRAPGALLLQLPLTAVSVDVAVLIERLVVAGSMVVLAWAAGRIGRWPAWVMVVVGGLLVATNPGQTAIDVGSQGPLVAALIGVSWVTRRGGPLGVAAVLKLFPLLMIPMVWWHDRKMAYSAAGVFAALNVAGLLLPDVSVVGTVTAMLRQPNAAAHNLTFSLSLPAMLVLGVGLVVAARWLSHDATMALGVVGMLALSPVVWVHYLPVLILPAAYCVRLLYRPTSKIVKPSLNRITAIWRRGDAAMGRSASD